jgi:putative aldouronate transport system substrate-binding protein
MKRCVVFVLLLALSVPFAFAAGQSDSSSAAEEVELIFRTIGPGKQKDAEMVWAEFNNMLPQYLPGTTVQIEVIPASEYADRWKLALSAGEQLDIAGRYWMQNLDVEVAKGGFLPLDDLIAEYGPNIKKNLPEWVLQKGMTAGKIYEIPNYQIMVGMRYAAYAQEDQALKYDLKSIARQIEPNEFMEQGDWDLFEEYFTNAKAGGDLQMGVSTTLGWLSGKGLEGVGQGASIEFGDPNLQVFNKYEHPSYKTLISTMAKWYEMDFIRKDVLAMDNPRADDYKPDGTLMYIHGMVGTEETLSMATTERWQYPYTVYALQREARVGYAHSSTNLAIPSTAKHPERAMQLIDLMQGEGGSDLFNLLTWGIEGTHYNVVREAGNGLPKRIETIGYAGQGNADSPYGLWKWAVGNTAFSWVTQADTDDYIDIWVDINNSAVASPLMGWVPDPNPTKTEEAQIAAVIGEYASSLEFGALGDGYLSVYEDFLAKLKAAGIDKVIAEYQRQIDAFKAGM